MTTDEAILYLTIGIIAIVGLWLISLTYLVMLKKEVKHVEEELEEHEREAMHESAQESGEEEPEETEAEPEKKEDEPVGEDKE